MRLLTAAKTKRVISAVLQAQHVRQNEQWRKNAAFRRPGFAARDKLRENRICFATTIGIDHRIAVGSRQFEAFNSSGQYITTNVEYALVMIRRWQFSMINMPVGMAMLVSIVIRRMRLDSQVNVRPFPMACLRRQTFMRVAMRNCSSSEHQLDNCQNYDRHAHKTNPKNTSRL